MNEKPTAESLGITFLKSTSHIRVLPEKGDRLRSALVGIQFGIVMLPYELLAVSIGPMVAHIFTDVFSAGHRAIMVLQASWSALSTGFAGKLEATEKAFDYVVEDLNNAKSNSFVDDLAMETEFESWWDEHGQFVRSGGSAYEKTFAWRAFTYARTGDAYYVQKGSPE